MGILIIINVVFTIFLFTLAYMSIRYFINQIEKYPKVTFEEVYNSKKLRQKYNIEDKANPFDYGFNYKEISEVLDRDVKAIDNALQRIKTKLKKIRQSLKKKEIVLKIS